MKIAIIKKKTIRRVTLLLLIATIAIVGYLLMNGFIWFNNPNLNKYPIRGVDVSHYQGDIDWNKLSNQGIDFAYIKATEGSSHLDKKFAINWEKSRQTDIVIGAYHFFSFESSGQKQAENFIKNVPVVNNTLPPVIDIEFYGKFSQDPLDADTVRKELDSMISELERYYSRKVVIYTTQSTYKMYIENFYKDNPIWIRNVYTRPHLSDDQEWTFWQYSDHGRLDGYKGIERFIDLNVFNGTHDEFMNFCTNAIN